ncbi:MAG: universal stress protein [Candidatus Neomarinimicrobiota bacterium]|nr:MAG: universal stress protein [Candidatus Neomarinimicrobiota bacterium]
MKFLIAIGSKEFSEPTLRIGTQIARAFQAEITILYVGEPVSSFAAHEVHLAQENLKKWNFDHPGVEVLEWAFNFLAEHGYITPKTIKAGFQGNRLVASGPRRYQVELAGTYCEEVKLILRQGDIIPELRDEVQRSFIDVTIIGGSQKRRMAHDLVQYLDSSIFVVNTYDPEKKYRILLPVDDSRGTRKAINFGIRVARAYGLAVDTLTVSKRESFGPGYRGAARRATKFLNRAGVANQAHFIVGDPVEEISKFGCREHIIVMGVSHKHPLKKFFTGSKPLKLMEVCSAPILIVK